MERGSPVIISASRRTDIPAFYGDWFWTRLQAGFVRVANPINPSQIRRIPLDRAAVDAFVFWTKSIAPFFPVLENLDRQGYPYYVQHTLNDYPPALEPYLPPLDGRLAALRQLSRQIGPERLMWRYDPIIITRDIRPQDHVRQFTHLCQILEGYVSECTFKFVDDYRKIRRRMNGLDLGWQIPDREVRFALAAELAGIARQHGILLQGCCEDDYGSLGLPAAACISRERLERICGYALPLRKDPGQRPGCNCVRSEDIGAYNTCRHGCAYCYACGNAGTVTDHLRSFSSQSEMLG
ncbi:MAG TPA: hypothetical protein DD640_04705 [Clostridiales bacterium]|nr:hypothetical protein [Clostridiales bacterium]